MSPIKKMNINKTIESDYEVVPITSPQFSPKKIIEDQI